MECISVPSYLAEAYVPRSRLQEARAAGGRARTAAERLSQEGMAVRYVRTTFLPDDETCFHVFEAASAQIVREVCRRAELGSPRIIPAMEWASRQGHEASVR
jgi:hypothetical protein